MRDMGGRGRKGYTAARLRRQGLAKSSDGSSAPNLDSDVEGVATDDDPEKKWPSLPSGMQNTCLAALSPRQQTRQRFVPVLP
jgi:hypothetical protein